MYFIGCLHCKRCQESFKLATGENIPELDSAPAEKLDRYMTWKSEMADKHMEKMKKTVKSSKYNLANWKTSLRFIW